MDFETWEPVYEAIVADFGYDRAADEAARDLLARLLGDAPTYDPAALELAGADVAVAGPDPSLADARTVVEGADVVLGASTAAATLRDLGLPVDCVVTDLDKHPEGVVQSVRAGVPVVVHAHGDNRPLLRRVVPDLSPSSVLPTTQAAPAPPVTNYGGFTDGDRAAFLADHFGAASLSFPGWNFEDPAVSTEKRRKLDWAARLLYWLECRRDERFPVLDGRRAGIDASVLPVA